MVYSFEFLTKQTSMLAPNAVEKNSTSKILSHSVSVTQLVIRVFYNLLTTQEWQYCQHCFGHAIQN